MSMKIGIVGTGHVGSTAAFSLLMQGIGSELVLVDADPALAEAQALDLLHATPFSHPVHVRSGDFASLSGCALIILAAGVAQQPGESRMQLLTRNSAVFADIVPQLMRYAPEAILLVASNPLDIMTQVATRLSGLPPERVIGSGTMLDTARFKALLAQRFKVAPGAVHAYVLGEHGDTEVLAWSAAQVAGLPLAEFAKRCGAPLDEASRADIDQKVRRAAYAIIAGKGSTYYGVGAALASLARAVLHDESAIFTACAMAPAIGAVSDVALSMPLVIGRGGVQQRVLPVLSEQEWQAFEASAAHIREHAAALGY